MRTECYERDLTEDGYTVLASRRIGEYCDTEAEPLKMRLSDRYGSFWPGFANKLSTALEYIERAEHEKRGLAACRRTHHKPDCQYGKGIAYQHGNPASYLRGVGL